MKNAIATWSGGKDSCLALYKALKQGYKIKYIANTITQKYKRVGFHGVTADLIHLQSKLINIPLLQIETTAENYNQKFIENLSRGFGGKIDAVIFGDIHLEECYQTSKSICKELNVDLVEPLWKMKQRDILNDFINAGFEAMIVSTQGSKLGKEWLGRKIDRTFIKDIEKMKGIDACGENGEFHTFVYDGPIFKEKLRIIKAGKLLRNGYWFLDIREK